MVPNIIAYHCNDRERCIEFVSSGKLIWCQEDGEWLGAGMYFWDNAFNANGYWKVQKIRHAPHKKYITVTANILLDHLLDLTDWDMANKVAKVWESYCKILHLAPDEPLGKKLNFLFDHNSKFSSNFFVLKIYGKYNRTFTNQLFGYNIHSCRTEPTLATKCIYSVRNANCICDKSFFDEEK